MLTAAIYEPILEQQCIYFDAYEIDICLHALVLQTLGESGDFCKLCRGFCFLKG